jgi:hypothetical protein
MSGGPVGPGPHTYKVVLAESEWDAVVAESGSTLTWVVTGRSSTGAVTRMVTTNDLRSNEPITIDLSMADAKVVATADLTALGWSLSGAGDVDGDGRDDVLVGAATRVDGKGDVLFGATFLMSGPLTGTLDLSLADAKLLGEDEYDPYFWSLTGGVGVSGAGDVDGDGHDDMLIGAGLNDEGDFESGAAYLVLGPVTGTLDLSFADAKMLGEDVYDRVGSSVSGAGDVDGDGHPDLLLGSRYNSEGGNAAGAAYLVLGTVTGTLDLSHAHAKLVGETELDTAGTAVSGAGDTDGDGHDDLLVGAWGNDEGGKDAGAAYLVLGPVSGTLDLSMADAKLVAENRDDHAFAVSAGDVDGDGRVDVLVGADGNDEGGVEAGAAYLVLGSFTRTRDLSTADAKLVGEGGGDRAGFSSVSIAGDVDGNGYDDLLVGAYGDDQGGGDAGAAYVVLGPVTGTLDLSLADAKLVGERDRNWAGMRVSGAGDVDGDGDDDVLIGAPTEGYAAVGRAVGAAYLIYGGGF